MSIPIAHVFCGGALVYEGPLPVPPAARAKLDVLAELQRRAVAAPGGVSVVYSMCLTAGSEESDETSLQPPVRRA